MIVTACLVLSVSFMLPKNQQRFCVKNEEDHCTEFRTYNSLFLNRKKPIINFSFDNRQYVVTCRGHVRRIIEGFGVDDLFIGTAVTITLSYSHL
jgi:hypothetical protein